MELLFYCFKRSFPTSLCIFRHACTQPTQTRKKPAYQKHSPLRICWISEPSFCVLIAHFTVMDGSEAGGDRVLIQTFLLYYVNQVVLMLINIFKGNFP